MKKFGVMKYLRRYLIHAGLCLLLVCSANVASAQVFVGLGDVETTRTSMGRIIDFNVKLSRQLTVSEVLVTQIQSLDVSPSEGSLADESNYTPPLTNCSLGRFLDFSSSAGISYRLCMDSDDQQDVDVTPFLLPYTKLVFML